MPKSEQTLLLRWWQEPSGEWRFVLESVRDRASKVGFSTQADLLTHLKSLITEGDEQ